jgi:hypothetical protein
MGFLHGTSATTNITILVGSDLHYTSSANTAIRGYIDAYNALPGTLYPTSVGGVVDAIDAVILNGDLTNDFSGGATEWNNFAGDWGLVGEKRCRFPLYEGAGNHDGPWSAALRQGIKARNKLRKIPVDTSPNGFHYSWDMGDVHFIQANLVMADTGFGATSNNLQRDDPAKALSFIRSDLAKHVGTSGRAVVLNHHFHMSGEDQYYPVSQRDSRARTLQGYNIIGIFCGHTHSFGYSKFHTTRIDLYDDGTMQSNGQCIIVHITDSTMTVVERNATSWGSRIATKRITTPDITVEARIARSTPAVPPGVSVHRAGGMYRIELKTAYSAPVVITDLRGIPVRRIPAAGNCALWDGTAATGVKAGPGVYIVHPAGRSSLTPVRLTIRN